MDNHKCPENKESKQGCSLYDETLVDEFCCLIAAIAVRLLTREDAERDNRGTNKRVEGKRR